MKIVKKYKVILNYEKYACVYARVIQCAGYTYERVTSIHSYDYTLILKRKYKFLMK